MPNNWKTYRIEEICTNITSGGTPNTRKLEYYNGNIPWLKTQEVNFNRIYNTDVKITEDGLKNSSAKIIPKDSVIIAMYGATAGRLAINKIPLCTNQACCNLTINNTKADFQFIYYNLLSRFDRIADMAVGGAQQNLNAGMIKNLEVQLPLLQEQKSIASILSAIDDKIENNLAINKTLEEMAMALYKHWFVDFGPFQDGEFVESELGRIPKGWEVKKIKDFGEVVCGKTPSKKDDDNYSDIGYPFIKIPDMHNNIWVTNTIEKISEKGNRTQIKKLLPIGSINVSCIATVGLVSINCFPSHTNQQINSIIPSEVFYRNYLYLSMLSLKETFLNEASGGSATLNMNTSTFANVKLLKPNNTSLLEFDSLAFDLFENVKNNQLENQTLTQLRDTLLPKLISGEVRLKEFQES